MKNEILFDLLEIVLVFFWLISPFVFSEVRSCEVGLPPSSWFSSYYHGLLWQIAMPQRLSAVEAKELFPEYFNSNDIIIAWEKIRKTLKISGHIALVAFKLGQRICELIPGLQRCSLYEHFCTSSGDIYVKCVVKKRLEFLDGIVNGFYIGTSLPASVVMSVLCIIGGMEALVKLDVELAAKLVLLSAWALLWLVPVGCGALAELIVLPFSSCASVGYFIGFLLSLLICVTYPGYLWEMRGEMRQILTSLLPQPLREPILGAILGVIISIILAPPTHRFLFVVIGGVLGMLIGIALMQEPIVEFLEAVASFFEEVFASTTKGVTQTIWDVLKGAMLRIIIGFWISPKERGIQEIIREIIRDWPEIIMWGVATGLISGVLRWWRMLRARQSSKKDEQ